MLIDLEFMLKSVEFTAKAVALLWRQLRNLIMFLKSAVKIFKSLESRDLIVYDLCVPLPVQTGNKHECIMNELKQPLL